ncbi:glycosyltransferase family 32 protein [Phocaeicola vulgatus]|jgi:mannosyltransferase OCH1-like enzyme|uniref:glycosyltransferase family 32 protein n=1 Tax=Phocaeicola vulgatus TaxID=821 RepID=UPI00374E0F59
MIPKVIHYCWFGRNSLPPLAVKCLESWKRFFPDYEIKEWNEDNFDVNIISYTAEAYRVKKYAFVSDYARFWILYHYGGLYFDTDVEVIKSMDDIIAKGSFMGCEKDADKEGATALAVAPGLGLYGETPAVVCRFAFHKRRWWLEFENCSGLHYGSAYLSWVEKRPNAPKCCWCLDLSSLLF